MSDDFRQSGGSPWGTPPGGSGGGSGNGSGRGPTPPDIDKIIREFQEKIKQSTKGVIQSWKIISSGKSQSGKMFEAKLEVSVSKLQLSSELKRMRFVLPSVKIRFLSLLNVTLFELILISLLKSSNITFFSAIIFSSFLEK